MWFGFGVITLLVAFFVSLHLRLAAGWKGVRRTTGRFWYEELESRHKGRLTGARFGVPVPKGWSFRVRAERGRDAWFKKIGVSVELETRDRAFDDAYYIESDDAGFGRLLANRPEMRRAIEATFAGGTAAGYTVGALRGAHERLWVEGAARQDADLAAAATDIVPALHAIADALNAEPRSADGIRDPFVWRAAALLSVSTASAVFGLVALFRSIAGRTDVLEPWALFAASLVPAAIALGAFLAFVVRFLGRSSRTHLVLVEALLVGGLGFVLSTYGLAREANLTFDVAAAREVKRDSIRTEHRERRKRRGRKTHHYYVYVDDWRAPGETLKLEIDAATYGQLPNGGSAVVLVRRGALGFEWIEAIRPVAQ